MTDTTTTETKKEPTTGSKRFQHRNFHTRLGLAQFLLRELQGEEPQNLVNFGIQSQAVTDFETAVNKVIGTDKKQEETKALLKTLTAQFQEEMDAVDAMYITLKKKIKAEADLVTWKKYGFADKQ
ncbi:MAG: hypothetical protein NT166_19840 [Candidatus Aminicenantes bacterium]|nr:hypothetical protein [Candidatus Aminicenantes bacterium]